MTIKEALYRELRYGSVLQGLVNASQIKLDMRNTISKEESSYPWLIFRRVINTEDNQVKLARERFEFSIIGLRSSATKGDALLDQIRTALLNEFSGKRKTWGKFEADGTADPDGGIRMSCHYVQTEEGFDADLEEKAHLLIFDFAHIRWQ